MDDVSDGARLALTVLLTAWVLAAAYSVYGFLTTEPIGDGFTRGLNRISTYLGWQGVAAMIAVPIYAIGRKWPKGATVRSLSWVPLAIALMHIAALAALWVYGILGIR